MRDVTKRRLLLGAAGVLLSLSLAVPVGAAGTGHGGVDVNDVTGGTHGGVIGGSDGNERNLNIYSDTSLVGMSPGLQQGFNYEETVEFNSSIGAALRVGGYDETYPEPKQGMGH